MKYAQSGWVMSRKVEGEREFAYYRRQDDGSWKAWIGDQIWLFSIRSSVDRLKADWDEMAKAPPQWNDISVLGEMYSWRPIRVNIRYWVEDDE